LAFLFLGRATRLLPSDLAELLVEMLFAVVRLEGAGSVLELISLFGARHSVLLKENGIDIYYIDESHDRNIYVVTAVCVPFLRNIEGAWTIAWPARFEAAREWRRLTKRAQGIPVSKELHGVKLIAGRGNFFRGKHNFSKAKASGVYRSILESIDFLPDASIMSVTANRGKFLYGNDRLEACMYALFQRMRTKASIDKVNALTFFDQGHQEYRRLYRMAQVHLPTGSMLGSWSGAATKNMPLDMFVKDANEKDSKHCFFTQAADLIAYAAFLKIKHERNELIEWQATYKLGTLYDEIPKKLLNTRASFAWPRDAIVRLK
jgi:hypothetical protein